MKRATWRSTGAVLLACTAAWAASSAQAQDASMVVRDAVTGELRAPTPDEARALTSQPAAKARSATRTTKSRGVITGSTTPRQWVMPNGTVIAETTEDMMSATVAVRGPDGKLVQHCTDNHAEAGHIADGKHVSSAKRVQERLDALE